MNYKSVFFISLFLLILSVSAVSATDFNKTTVTESSLHLDDSLVVNEHINFLNSFKYENANIDIENQSINDSTKLLESENGTAISSGTFDDLQVEINNSPSGSVLDLYRDYTGNYGSRIHFNKDLTIDGHGHTLDCLNQGGCSVFYSNSGLITLKNLIITNGHNDYTDKGGALYITGSAQYILENCIFENNWAEDYGGAIYNDVDKPLTIFNCTFKSNTAYKDNGGAIFSKGKVIINGSTFDSNLASEDGGAIKCINDIQVTKSIFTNNKVQTRDWSWYEYIYHWASIPQCYGGAISCEETIYIENSTFNSNCAQDYAGAISAKYVKINQKQNNPSFFINNNAEDNDGGAIYIKEDGDISNTIFSKNSAKGDGGAIKAEIVNIYNSTFDGNHVGGCGGGVNAKNVNINQNQYMNQSFNSFFINNHADDDGGAIYTTNDLNANNVFFFGNNAYDSGGAIFAKGIVNVNHCELDNNTVYDAILSQGGGIYSKSGVNVENSTFIGNYARSLGSAIYCIKNIKINKNSNGAIYFSYFINNFAKGSNTDQIVCDKDHGEISFIRIVFA